MDTAYPFADYQIGQASDEASSLFVNDFVPFKKISLVLTRPRQTQAQSLLDCGKCHSFPARMYIV